MGQRKIFYKKTFVTSATSGIDIYVKINAKYQSIINLFWLSACRRLSCPSHLLWFACISNSEYYVFTTLNGCDQRRELTLQCKM